MAPPSKRITVREFEKQIWDIEGICLVVRAPGTTAVKPYEFIRASSANWRYSQLESKLEKCLDNFEFVITDGKGHVPARNMTLARIRESYSI